MLKSFIQNLWRWKCDMPEIETNPTKNIIDDLFQSEWSDQFEKLCRNRLVMSALRYGKLNDPDKAKYDRTESIKHRIKFYEETGNLEYLVDIANLAMLEFEEGCHPLKHFKSIDDGEHVEIKR